nr:hypothetical protein CFP56_36177 [Quercus suber]
MVLQWATFRKEVRRSTVGCTAISINVSPSSTDDKLHRWSPYQYRWRSQTGIDPTAELHKEGKVGKIFGSFSFTRRPPTPKNSQSFRCQLFETVVPATSQLSSLASFRGAGLWKDGHGRREFNIAIYEAVHEAFFASW